MPSLPSCTSAIAMEAVCTQYRWASSTGSNGHPTARSSSLRRARTCSSSMRTGRTRCRWSCLPGSKASRTGSPCRAPPTQATSDRRERRRSSFHWSRRMSHAQARIGRMGRRSRSARAARRRSLRPRLTVGTPDANGAAANSSGHVLLDVTVGNASTLAIEADVFDRVLAHGRALHRGSRSRRIADPRTPRVARTTRHISAACSCCAVPTVTTCRRARAARRGLSLTTPVEFRPECFATSDTARGGACRLSTTANALMPGLVAEGRRANWEIGAVRVHDDVPASAGAVFATQGVFVP